MASKTLRPCPPRPRLELAATVGTAVGGRHGGRRREREPGLGLGPNFLAPKFKYVVATGFRFILVKVLVGNASS